MNLSISETIADFVKSVKYKDLPEKVIELSKEALIDYTGVMFAGSKENSVQSVLKYIKKRGSRKEVYSLALNKKFNLEDAAMLDAISSHVLDYDDVSWATIGHPSVVLAPVCYSVGQKYNSSGKDIILSYALGLEAMHKIAKITMPNVSENGWHTTSVYGVYGATIVASVLKKSSKEEIINALGIASSKASGIRSNFGTDVKSYHAGMACTNGIQSVYLASGGLKSSEKSIEAPDGFAKTFANLDFDKNIKLKLGKKWDMLENGIVFKQYPCCSGSHCAADLSKEMKNKFNINYKNIKNIKIGCSLLAPKELNCSYPKTALEAKFSMRFAVASMLIGDELNLNSYKEKIVNSVEYQELMNKMDVQIDSEFKKLGFIGTSPARIKILMDNGKEYEDFNMLAKGNPEKKLSLKEIRNKFLKCSIRIKNSNKIFKILLKLEKEKNLNNLLKHI